MDLTIVGLLGSFIVLGAFLGNQTKRLSSESVLYDFLNFLGSAFLLIYSIFTNSIPFIIVNIVWGGFSLKDVITYYLKK